MDRIAALLKDWMASLRRLAAGPATLERTLTLTLGGLVLAAIEVPADERARGEVGLVAGSCEPSVVERALGVGHGLSPGRACSSGRTPG